ncbi:MAG TPA: DUF1684 domain-containing protein [Steroidobacteraceae bacterium]|nr:DUF1684 domain-containing protein [Steroidobacteraceae bacterium]
MYSPAVLIMALALSALSAPRSGATRAAPSSEEAAILQWRAQRVAELTSDTGWLTLAGLFWLKEGSNSFGSGPDNTLILDSAALAKTAGTFQVNGALVRFVAHPGAGVLLDGQGVDSVILHSDRGGEPTVLASGSLRFFVIERGGRLGVRVRDLDNPRRLGFHGLQYFPISARWVLNARFIPYPPDKRIRIINILGMEEEAVSPGALEFTQYGRKWRLDTVLEQAADQQLFIMFADATSGQQTYGGGRFLYIPLPVAGGVVVDFNKAYNPPCALNDFATCPLPPPQNRLKLRIDAGELKYAGGPRHSP